VKEPESTEIPHRAFPRNFFDAPLRWCADEKLIILDEDGTATTSRGGEHFWRRTAPDTLKLSWASTMVNRGLNNTVRLADDVRTGQRRKATESEISRGAKGKR